MSKSNRSVFTSLSGMSLTLINGLLSLIVTKIVISSYGSDFNGVNSTANQLVNMLMIVEGGFTLAASVALFGPIKEGNTSKINMILSAAKRSYFQKGMIFFVAGTFAAIGYSFFIKSNLPIYTIMTVFLLTVGSTGFALVYEAKYRIILQSVQKEYLINMIRIVTIVISQLIVIIVIRLHLDMILIRLVTSIGMIIGSLCIGLLCKRQYPKIAFNIQPDFDSIKGTNDIFIAKFTGMVYKSAPMIFIAATSGAVFASVYGVYNSVFLLIKGLLISFSNGPRMALGQLVKEKGENYVYQVFTEYEFLVNQLMLIFLTSATVLIMPFIDVYTYNVTDVIYKNWFVAIFLILATYFDIIHLPAGNMIYMAGQFRLGRNIQVISAVFLIITLLLGYFFWGFEGIMLSILLTSVLLALLEINTIYRNFFDRSVFDFLIRLLPSTAFAVAMVFIQLQLLPKIFGYLQFAVWGFIIFSLNVMAFLVFGMTFYPKIMRKVSGRLVLLLGKFK